jgi:hypothetical protein
VLNAVLATRGAGGVVFCEVRPRAHLESLTRFGCQRQHGSHTTGQLLACRLRGDKPRREACAPLVEHCHVSCQMACEEFTLAPVCQSPRMTSVFLFERKTRVSRSHPRITPLDFGESLRIRRAASIPFRDGRPMSSRIRSGWSCSAFRTASSPSECLGNDLQWRAVQGRADKTAKGFEILYHENAD